MTSGTSWTGARMEELQEGGIKKNRRCKILSIMNVSFNVFYYVLNIVLFV